MSGIFGLGGGICLGPLSGLDGVILGDGIDLGGSSSGSGVFSGFSFMDKVYHIFVFRDAWRKKFSNLRIFIVILSERCTL